MTDHLPAWVGLAPVLALAATGLALFVVDMLDPDDDSPTLLVGVSVVGTLTALGLAGWLLSAGAGFADGSRTLFGQALVVDGMALFFQALFAAVTGLVLVASFDYLQGRDYQAEYYALIMLAATGMALMATANSLATAFISLELASLSSYALVGFLKTNEGSVEGGLKYFLIGALSSAVFAFGISLLYGATGSLILSDVAAGLREPAALVGGAEGISGIAAVGVLMVAGGFAFKTASVPFQFWAPEAYEGAPAPVTAFLSSASKAAGFALMFRVFTVAFPLDGVGIDWMLLFQVLAVVTMTLGNFAAALLVYGFMNTGAFLFVALAENWGVGRRFEDYAGLGRQVPIAAVAMSVFMFSLAGLPPFGGFFSKLFLFGGAIDAGYWWLAAAGAVNSTLSLFYYSRVVKALWLDDPDQPIELTGTPTGLYAAVVVAAVGTLLLLPAFGPVIGTAEAAAVGLVP